jgi:tripartite-type tricarboxylate transporter receptor subunit TctC
MLVAHPSVPVSNVGELIALARANPGALNFGSAGNGSIMHLAMELFASMADIRMTHIPYKSAGPALLDVVAGRVQLLFNTTGIIVPYAQSGKLKVLAASTARRAQLFPDVPTVSEAGVKGYELFNWFGIFAPAGTPRPVVERLNNATNMALAQPKVLERIRAGGAEEYPGTAEELAAQVRIEFEKYGKLVRALGLKAE